jgi:hypothetical protein
MDKDIPTEEMTMKMLASRPSTCVTSWQEYDTNRYLYENYVSHFILMLIFICMELNLSPISYLLNVSLSYAQYRSSFLLVLSRSIERSY